MVTTLAADLCGPDTGLLAPVLYVGVAAVFAGFVAMVFAVVGRRRNR